VVKYDNLSGGSKIALIIICFSYSYHNGRDAVFLMKKQ
jgi:hypothetical protein